MALLDDHSGAVAAWSMRKLRDAYSGPCLEVQRESDGATQDIGFTGSPARVDSAAIQSFVGSSRGYLTTWYGQTPNSRDLTASSSWRPILVYDGRIRNDDKGRLFIPGGLIERTLRRGSGIGISGSTNRFISAIAKTISVNADKEGVRNVFTINSGDDDDVSNGRRWTMRLGGTGDKLRVEVKGTGEASSITVPQDDYFVFGTALEGTNFSDITVFSPSTSEALSSSGTVDTNDRNVNTHIQASNGFSDTHLVEVVAYDTDRASDRSQILTDQQGYADEGTVDLPFVGGYRANFIDNPWPDENGDQPTLYHKSNFSDGEYRVLTTSFDSNGNRTWKLRKTPDFQSFTMIDSDFLGGNSRVGNTLTFQDHFIAPNGDIVLVTTEEDGNSIGIWRGADFQSMSFVGTVSGNPNNNTDPGVFFDEANDTVHIYVEANDKAGVSPSDGILHCTTPISNLTDGTWHGWCIDTTNESHGVGDPEIVKRDGTFLMFCDRSVPHPEYYIDLYRSENLFDWYFEGRVTTDRQGGDWNMVAFNDEYRAMVEFDDAENRPSDDQTRIGLWSAQDININLANAAASATDTTVSGSVDTDTGSGTLYAVTQEATKAAPSNTQVKNGNAGDGAAASGSTSKSITSTGTKSVSFSGLSASTDYQVYFYQETAALDTSYVTSSQQVTTGSSARTLDASLQGAPGTLNADLAPTVTINAGLQGAAGTLNASLAPEVQVDATLQGAAGTLGADLSTGAVDTATVNASLQGAAGTMNATLLTIEKATVTASLQGAGGMLNAQIGDIPRLATLEAKLTD